MMVFYHWGLDPHCEREDGSLPWWEGFNSSYLQAHPRWSVCQGIDRVIEKGFFNRDWYRTMGHR